MKGRNKSMPRPKRICLPDVTYHVYSRCIEKKPLMRNTKMKDLFISVLKFALEKYDFKLIDYTIMNNHFHLFIKTEKNGATISQIMQFIKSQYAQRYNRRMDRTGPFWNERFGSSITEMSKSPRDTFFITQQYIAFNPVKSNYVQDPRRYRYSGIRSYYEEGYISPVTITFHPFFLELGSTFKERARKLLEFEDQYRKRIFHESIFT
jgi:putative transposase